MATLPTPASHQLRIICDAGYPEIIADCRTAIQLSLVGVRVHARGHPVDRCMRVEASSTWWPDLFPQAGPGRKHERVIALEPWQQSIVHRFP
jgi:hypothetical protein